MAKRKKDFLPKRVGRLRIPKPLRRGVFGAALGSTAGQVVIAALLLKAGSRLAARATGSRQAADSIDAGVPFAAQSARAAAPAPPASGPRLNIKHALGQATLAFILGLSHPKSAPKGPRRAKPAPAPAPAPERPNGATAVANAPAAAAAPGDGGAVPPAPEKRGAHSH